MEDKPRDLSERWPPVRSFRKTAARRPHSCWASALNGVDGLAQIHGAYARVLEKVGSAVAKDNATVLHHVAAISQAKGLLRVLLDDEDRRTLFADLADD